MHRLVEMGIDCLKIEGRTKSHYYAARTSQAYRQAIDQAMAGHPLNPKLIGVLENLAHRGYTDGFYKRHHSVDHQNYITGASQTHRQEFVGEMVGRDGEFLIIDVKNKFSVGDTLELILPSGQNKEVVLHDLRNDKGQPIDVAPGNGYLVRIPSFGIQEDYVLVSRFLDRSAQHAA